MAALPDSARALLTSNHLVHLSTVNPDGSPQVSIVWTDVEGDEILFAHLGDGQKIKNIRREPRVVLSVDGDADALVNGALRPYLLVHGTARVTDGGGPELLEKLAARYIGPDADFPAPDAPPGVVVRIAVDRIGGVGPWHMPW
jgi:PPOX class probable F420-dependent enzyme